MKDTIRIDDDELIRISDDLRNLAQEMEDLGGALRLAQYQLPDSAQESMHAGLMQIHRAMAQLMEQTQETSARIVRAAQDFAHCEHGAAERFERLREDTMLRLGMISGQKNGKNRLA